MPFAIWVQRYNKNFNCANKWHIFFSQGIKKRSPEGLRWFWLLALRPQAGISTFYFLLFVL